ncbi:MAG: sigma 54-interacting transcriptional regulator [Candidatus Krumholzibacteriia bacterium]
MRMDDLKLSELLEFDSESGIVRFAGERAVIVDATANGTLRKELVSQFGVTATRAILTRFGFVQGWRMADAMQDLFQWDSEDDWSQACGRIHMLGGMYRLAPSPEGSLTGDDGLTLIDSYEAEQHLAHLGLSDISACWTICGLTSGYLSRALGQEIYVLEDRCIARGDASCHLVGRTLQEWGEEHVEDLRYYQVTDLKEWLEPSLQAITTSLKAAERTLRERQRTLARIVPDVDGPGGIINRSAPMRKVVDLARRIAKVDFTVLVTGESGAGKELVARLVHDESSRAHGPFVAVNCGAITETLLESELFGHARGAFTGAMQARIGLFEATNGGTLLLDEIGDVSPGMQVKLLRVLQEREIRRVGENRDRPVNVRVIAATNHELAVDIAQGTFRQDLFYRLNVVQLHVPPLRERRDDILPLARVLLEGAAKKCARRVTGLTPRAADQLLRYDWPGNVRELDNAMESAVAVGSSSRIEFDDLPEAVRCGVVPSLSLSGPVRALAEVERDYILAVLDLHEGNKTRTAKELGIGSATLYRKLKEYDAAKAVAAKSAG